MAAFPPTEGFPGTTSAFPNCPCDSPACPQTSRPGNFPADQDFAYSLPGGPSPPPSVCHWGLVIGAWDDLLWAARTFTRRLPGIPAEDVRSRAVIRFVEWYTAAQPPGDVSAHRGLLFRMVRNAAVDLAREAGRLLTGSSHLDLLAGDRMPRSGDAALAAEDPLHRFVDLLPYHPDEVMADFFSRLRRTAPEDLPAALDEIAGAESLAGRFSAARDYLKIDGHSVEGLQAMNLRVAARLGITGDTLQERRKAWKTAWMRTEAAAFHRIQRRRRRAALSPAQDAPASGLPAEAGGRGTRLRGPPAHIRRTPPPAGTFPCKLDLVAHRMIAPDIVFGNLTLGGIVGIHVLKRPAGIQRQQSRHCGPWLSAARDIYNHVVDTGFRQMPERTVQRMRELLEVIDSHSPGRPHLDVRGRPVPCGKQPLQLLPESIEPAGGTIVAGRGDHQNLFQPAAPRRQGVVSRDSGEGGAPSAQADQSGAGVRVSQVARNSGELVFELSPGS